MKIATIGDIVIDNKIANRLLDKAIIILNGDSCWEWTRGKNRYGYGIIGIGRKCFLAHRISFVIFGGDLKDNECVLYTCDNPACIRPEHLFSGTRLDNARDCIEKGRFKKPLYGDESVFKRYPEKFRGEKSGNSKLTRDQVSTIRYIRNNYNTSFRDIGIIFGISASNVHRIIDKQLWKEEE